MVLRESSAEHWDEADFRAIFQQHYARIVDILVRLLGDRAHADDVANDAFWRLYRQPALQTDGNVGGWLYRTATNLGVDALRTSGRRRQHEEAASRIARENIQGGPLDNLLREERCRRVRQVRLDVIAAKLITGKPLKILKAIQVIPHGVQSEM